MTIKTTGSLSLDEIATEYNGTVSHSISEYYGAPGLPSSGSISFSDFYGKSDLYTTSRETQILTYAGEDSFSTTITTYFDTSWSDGNPT